MKPLTLLKRANSKGALAKAVVFYQRALQHYANESNWAVRGEDIVWLGDDDPTYAAQVSLGQRKADPKYVERNKKRVREPDIEHQSETLTPEAKAACDAEADESGAAYADNKG